MKHYYRILFDNKTLSCRLMDQSVALRFADIMSKTEVKPVALVRFIPKVQVVLATYDHDLKTTIVE